MLLAPLSNLEFPFWRAPGFDPTHPASPGIRFSAAQIALNGQAQTNLLSGKAITGTNLSGSTVCSLIGPAQTIVGGSNYMTVPPLVSETFQQVTMACIFQHNGAAGSNAQLVATASANGVNRMGLSYPSNVPGWTDVATNTALFSATTLHHSYFFALSASVSAGVVNAVLFDLSTGKLLTNVLTQAVTAEANGASYAYGGIAVSTGGSNSYIAAGMLANSFMSLQQLVAWAADPWAFWYPDDDLDYRIVGKTGGLAFMGLSAARFRSPSTFSGAQTMAGLGAARMRAQAASAQASVVAGRSASVNKTQSAQSLAAAFTGASSARAPSRSGASLAATFAAASRAVTVARGATGAGAFFVATGAMKALTTARGAASLMASLSAGTTANFGGRGATGLVTRIVARSSAVGKATAQTTANALFVATAGVARASFGAAGAIARLAFNPGVLLKAPLTTRVLSAPLTTRVLKAIRLIRTLKAP